jgi:hypothetical protein
VKPSCVGKYSLRQVRPSFVGKYSLRQVKPSCVGKYSLRQVRPSFVGKYSLRQVKPSCDLHRDVLMGRSAWMRASRAASKRLQVKPSCVGK